MSELTESERVILAREVAADYYRHGHYYTNPRRQAFCDGWDAAMDYMTAQAEVEHDHDDPELSAALRKLDT